MTTFFIVLMLFLVYFQIRNTLVLRERLKMNDLIFSQDDWYNLSSLKDEISYNNMLWHLWVWPISSMWPKRLQELRASNG